MSNWSISQLVYYVGGPDPSTWAYGSPGVPNDDGAFEVTAIPEPNASILAGFVLLLLTQRPRRT